MAAANTAIHLGVTGPVTAGVGACAAGAIALIEGYHLLRRGEVDVVLAGGTTPSSGRTSSPRWPTPARSRPRTATRPPSRGRSTSTAPGFVRLRGRGDPRARDGGARPGARRDARSASSPAAPWAATRTTSPSPEPTGAGAERVIRAALRNAGDTPERHRRRRRPRHRHAAQRQRRGRRARARARRSRRQRAADGAQGRDRPHAGRGRGLRGRRRRRRSCASGVVPPTDQLRDARPGLPGRRRRRRAARRRRRARCSPTPSPSAARTPSSCCGRRRA